MSDSVLGESAGAFGGSTNSGYPTTFANGRKRLASAEHRIGMRVAPRKEIEMPETTDHLSEAASENCTCWKDRAYETNAPCLSCQFAAAEDKGRSEERERLTNERAVGIVTAAVERFEEEVTKALLSARPHEALGTVDRSIGVRRGFDRLLASLDSDQEAGNG